MIAFLWAFVWNVMIWLWILLVLFLTNKFVSKITNKLWYIVSLTVWLLLWIIFLGFFPKIFSNIPPKFAWFWILIGLFLFYILELFLHWHHCKDLEHKDSHCLKMHKHGSLMFLWTFLHNAIHWLVLFSAFSIDLYFWLVTTFAIFLHSIPQNVANLIMNKHNAKISYVAAVGWIVWALLTYPFSEFFLSNKFYILAIISWWLLYIALSDIFPEIKEKWTNLNKLINLIIIFLWIGLFLLIEFLSMQFK